MIIQQRIRFLGKVQGIGLRYRIKTLAEQNGIRGYIQNNSDGSVTCVLCGEQETVQKALEQIPRLQGVHIEKTHIHDEPAQAWGGFHIRRE